MVTSGSWLPPRQPSGTGTSPPSKRWAPPGLPDPAVGALPAVVLRGGVTRWCYAVVLRALARQRDAACDDGHDVTLCVELGNDPGVEVAGAPGALGEREFRVHEEPGNP